MSNEKITPFTYLGYINSGTKGDIVVDDKIYNQYLINRALSLHIDTIAIVNEINKYGSISNQMHFDFLRNMVTPRKRFAKWPKPKEHGDASVISTYYGISVKKAYDYIGLLSDEDIAQMKEELKVE